MTGRLKARPEGIYYLLHQGGGSRPGRHYYRL